MTDGKQPQYRNMRIDEEVTFKLPAVDACIFMAWAMQEHIDTGAVNHIFDRCFAPQFEEQLFVPASLKAARADMYEKYEKAQQEAREQINQLFGGVFNTDGPPSMFANGVTVVCDICGSRDHYNDLPFGELTCGHNGPRHGIAET